MKTAAIPSLPAETLDALKALGAGISRARRRQGLRAQDLAAAAGMSRTTLAKVEDGDPTASMGAYAAALAALGMGARLAAVAEDQHDARGLALQAETLPLRVVPTRRRGKA